MTKVCIHFPFSKKLKCSSANNCHAIINYQCFGYHLCISDSHSLYMLKHECTRLLSQDFIPSITIFYHHSIWESSKSSPKGWLLPLTQPQFSSTSAYTPISQVSAPPPPQQPPFLDCFDPGSQFEALGYPGIHYVD